MAYVIAVCGSGGKTTLVKSIAKKYASENKKVCVTTTTHMWYDDDVKSTFIMGPKTVGADTIRPFADTNDDTVKVDINNSVGADTIRPSINKLNFETGKIYYIANLNSEKELIAMLSDKDYKYICEIFDYVIIEADGSRSMPMKIPRENEPTIPSNVDEIIVVVGMEAVGREIGAVCHRFNEFYGNDKYLSDNNIKPETIVTENLLDAFVKHYYFEPLSKLYRSSKVSIYKNSFDKMNVTNGVLCSDRHIVQNILIVLLASGFSKRFGSNKLMMNVAEMLGEDLSNDNKEQCEIGLENKKLYQFMIDKLLSAKEQLKNKLNAVYKEIKLNNSIAQKNKFKELSFDIDIAVVSQYDEILNDYNYIDKVTMIKNDDASLGMSESIKKAIKYYSREPKKSQNMNFLEVTSVDYKNIRDNQSDIHTQDNLSEGKTEKKNVDAIVFVNADMPYLPDKELANFIFNSILNKNGIAVMYSDGYKNPAYFEKKYFDEILKISGDKGPRELFDKYKMEVYKYYISGKYLVDIDTKGDLLIKN